MRSGSRSALFGICGASLLATSSLAANLLPNSGFDTDLAGWTVSPTGVAWDPLDAASSQTSGSVAITASDTGGGRSAFVCVPAQEGVLYDYSVSQFAASGQPDGAATLHLEWYAQPGCTDNVGVAPYVYSNATDSWTRIGSAAPAPAGTQSVIFSMLETTFGSGSRTANFDDAFLPEPDPAALQLCAVLALVALRRRSA